MDAFLLYFEDNLEFLLRMVVASLCGGIVGYERSRRRKEAGLRTHILVALGSALLMIISKYGFYDVLNLPGIRLDASRIAANVITGISFLGAGVIFVRDISIKGLTTAAGLWSVAGIGMAIGAGMYLVGVFATILILVIQIFCQGPLKKLDGPIYETFSITYEDIPNGLDILKMQLKMRNILIHHIQMEKNANGTVTVTMHVSRQNAITCTDLADIFANDPLVKSFRL
ncbi:MAG: MgtC/SapB family protein [Anaerotignum sp.]|nr:MgtC/SapB family protein [Anaerotignum sp.]